MIQNTRSALAYGSAVITCLTSRVNGSMPVVGSHRPFTCPRCTSQAARYCQRPAAGVVVFDPRRRALPGGRVGWQRQRTWIDVFSSAQITKSLPPKGWPCQIPA